MSSLLPPESGRLRPRSLAQEVVDALSAQILGGDFSPGSKLPSEMELMHAQGVSRTVIREAILKLQAAGLVETRPGIGSFVLAKSTTPTRPLDVSAASATTQAELLAILELRMCIETETAAFAAQRATQQEIDALRRALLAIETLAKAGQDAAAADFAFHMLIARATGNAYLVRVLEQLDPAALPRARLDPGRYLSRVNSEHNDVFEAIARGDSDGARAAMRTHLVNSRERFRRAIADAAGNRASP